MVDVSIITVSWNIASLLRKSLQAIFENTKGITFEVWVVDNASLDGTQGMVQREFPQVRCILNEKNQGFAKANNQAIRKANGRYILLLNPDMRVFPDTLSQMVSWMDTHATVGIAGCHLIREDGTTVPHVRRFPRLADQVAIVTKIAHVFPVLLDGYLMRDFDYTKEAEVDSIRGSFFMIRREVLEGVGLLDEQYFVWFEEVDYCKRVKQAGWQVMYTPAVRCVDYVGKSFEQLQRFNTQKLFTESMVKYFKKWHPRFESLILTGARPIGLSLAWLVDRFRRL